MTMNVLVALALILSSNVNSAISSPSSTLTPLEGSRIYFLHIAKTAGGSAILDIQNRLKQKKEVSGRDLKLTSSEGCLGCALHEGGYDHFTTMLRAPRAQVVSQFFFLRSSGGWCSLDKAEGDRNYRLPHPLFDCRVDGTCVYVYI